MTKTIIHQLSLVGIGGVQQSFVPYLQQVLKNSHFKHNVYGMHELDENYKDIEKYYTNINASLFNKLKFLYFLYSKKNIVHFYNNLGSHSVNKLLKFITSSNIIFHERGTVWNAKDEDKEVYLSNASKAKIILANSNASKIMLSKRFGIDENKIKVVYNGFLSKYDDFIPKDESRYSDKFSVGYIGRLDTPKGVHVLIETAKFLADYSFFIAGTGTLESMLKDLAIGYDNIHFVGRIKEPLEFISKMDLIVVPSIREPLGNTVIEAGYCKKPVIASNVDGIAEIVENGVSGILLEPKNKLSIKELPKDSVPIPNVVVNPQTKQLQEPKEIDCNELCKAIKELEGNTLLRKEYGKKLYEVIKERFTIENYFAELEQIYMEI
jgi:glycosyltransferase involved in cell wall biosynthesis